MERHRIGVMIFLGIVGLPALLTGCAPSGREDRDALSGHWVGRMPLGGLDTVTVVLDLGRVGSRRVGQYDVPDYNLTDYPVNVIVESLVVIEFSGVEADFRGRSGRNALDGILVQDGRNDPARFVRRGDPEFSEGFLALEQASEEGTGVRLLSADAAELRDAFNAESSRPRLIFLLSPS